MKIAHLRALPRAPAARPPSRRSSGSGETSGRANAGVSADEQARIDALVADLSESRRGDAGPHRGVGGVRAGAIARAGVARRAASDKLDACPAPRRSISPGRTIRRSTRSRKRWERTRSRRSSSSCSGRSSSAGSRAPASPRSSAPTSSSITNSSTRRRSWRLTSTCYRGFALGAGSRAGRRGRPASSRSLALRSSPHRRREGLPGGARRYGELGVDELIVFDVDVDEGKRAASAGSAIASSQSAASYRPR